MFSPGCFSYTLGSVARATAGQMINPADILVATPELFVERNRDAAEKKQKSNYFSEKRFPLQKNAGCKSNDKQPEQHEPGHEHPGKDRVLDRDFR